MMRVSLLVVGLSSCIAGSADARGMVEKDMEEIAACIDLVLKAIGTDREATAIAEAKQRVHGVTSRFPLPYHQ